MSFVNVFAAVDGVVDVNVVLGVAFPGLPAAFEDFECSMIRETIHAGVAGALLSSLLKKLGVRVPYFICEVLISTLATTIGTPA